ncbi:hypothetical protein J2847_005789 [Azospirillum agricola]|uniref:replication protein RepA n=1 Tax=Azospirillum agricola TaxID=1720247 RepID=UPI001AE56BB8|nr:replication protein RepA [Azospirillum agricola]MBP2232460.1 hypothetical protein [Azospirillum agricola]
MSEARRLIQVHGVEEARRIAPQELRPAIDIASQVLASEENKTGFSYSGFALTALPYRQLATSDNWVKEGHDVTLSIDPGTLKINNRIRRFGVPYGSYARLVLIYLQSEAVKNSSPHIELGGSLREFVTGKLGREYGGKTGTLLMDQIYRLAACSMRFFWSNAHGDGFEAKNIIKSGYFYRAGAGDAQAQLWDDEVVLDADFYGHLKKHAVPLLDEAVRALADDAVALDVYIWLAYRLRVVDRPTPVTWAALHAQFGTNYKLVRQFKHKFIPNLQKALAAYDGAVVSIEDTGVVLHPSRPPVSRLR